MSKKPQSEVLLKITKSVKKLLKDSSLEVYIFLLSVSYELNFSCVPVDAFYLFSITNSFNQMKIENLKIHKPDSRMVAQPKVFPFSKNLISVCKSHKRFLEKRHVYLFVNEKHRPFHFYSISNANCPVPLNFFTTMIEKSKTTCSRSIIDSLALIFLSKEQEKKDEIETE